MKNDRLILSLVKSGRLTADMISGQVYLDGKPKGTKHSSGYIKFVHTHNGKRRHIACQRVVWICDKKQLPKYGDHCDHGDNDKTNNARYNLEMVTPAVNTQRAHRNGLCDHIKRHANRCSTGQFTVTAV